MPRKQSIEFFEVERPISDLATKFGGQPNWLAKSEWPLSKALGEPMRFVGQIALDPEIFGNISARMAYLFMTDDPDVDGTWEAEGGENALILQPGRPEIKTESLSKGPTLFRMDKRFFGAMTYPKTVEFGVRLIPGEDPTWLSEKTRRELSDGDLAARATVLSGNKIGGVPGFLQGDEIPFAGPWKLVLQLDSTKLPFRVNFGDAGVGYAFIPEDGSR